MGDEVCYPSSPSCPVEGLSPSRSTLELNRRRQSRITSIPTLRTPLSFTKVFSTRLQCFKVLKSVTFLYSSTVNKFCNSLWTVFLNLVALFTKSWDWRNFLTLLTWTWQCFTSWFLTTQFFKLQDQPTTNFYLQQFSKLVPHCVRGSMKSCRIAHQLYILSVGKGCLYTPLYLANAPAPARIGVIIHPIPQLLPRNETRGKTHMN